MNTWLFAILAIITGSHLFECLVSWLKLQALRTELPDEFIGVLSPNDYKKSQEYIKDTTRFALISSSVTTITTLLFLVLGGFNTVDLFTRIFGYGEIFTGLIFTGCLTLLTFLLEPPFRFFDLRNRRTIRFQPHDDSDLSRLKHMWAMLIASFIQTCIMFLILSVILKNMFTFNAFGMMHTSVYASPCIFFRFIFST